MYDKNQIEDSLEFVRQIKDFYENDDFLTDFDPMEERGDAELFANLAENLEQKNRPMESVAQGAQAIGADFASSEQEKRRQLEEERIAAEKRAAEERRAAQEERRLLEEERRRLQQEIKQRELQAKQQAEEERRRLQQEIEQRELQERQRAAQEERRRQAEIEEERRRIEKERQAALEEQRKQEELRKQIEEERRRLAEEQRLAAERRAAEEKLAAERRAAEEERRRVEQERQAALEEQRKIEEERRRLAAEQKLAAERRAAEEKLAAERRAAEEERRRIEQERQRLVEERLQREIEEQKRLVAEQRRREEEEKRRREAEEKKRRQELVLAEERRRKELEEEERRKAAREQEERIAAEKKRQEAELAEQQRRKQILEEQKRLQAEQVSNIELGTFAGQGGSEKKDEVKPGTTAQEEAAIAAAPIINIATPNTSPVKAAADTEVSRLQKRAEELQRQAEMATLEARMRQLQLEAQAAQGVYPKPQINIPNAGNATANGALPMAQISIPGAANNADGGNNGSKKMSKDEIDNIFLRELEKFQKDDEGTSTHMKSTHPLQKYINNFDGKTFSSLIPAEKLLDVGYKVKDVIDDQVWNIKHFIQKKIDNSGDIEAQQKTKKFLSNLLVVAVCVFFAYLIAMMITNFVAHPTKVEGESMETTLTHGDTVVIQKMSYYLGHPERYDVVVFPVPNYNSKTYYIKRVIGLPGETVQIKDGKVYINDKELDTDKYGKDEYISDPGVVAEPVTLAKNEYFVLGDNRNMSTDSRSNYVGMVNERYIIGKAWERIWPLSKLGSIGK